MDKHYRLGKGTALFQSILKVKVIVELKTHPPKDNYIHFGLHGDPGQKLVVGLAGN